MFQFLLALAFTGKNLYRLDERSREGVANLIVTKLLEAGDISDAIATTKPIKDKTYAYGAISAKLVEGGKISEAIQLVSTTDGKSIEEDPVMLYEPAPGLLAKGHRQAELMKWPD